MGWETRGNNQYYYRKTRRGNRVISEFVGSDELAELLSQFDEIDRVKAEMERENELKSLTKLNNFEADLDELEGKVNLLTENYLESRGFYKTSSREWRLKAK